MDYEKEYKEALERAKAGKPMDEVFPELKESDDERTRKEIIDFLTDGIWNTTVIDKVKQSQRYAKWIVYLEKQKERNNGMWSEDDEGKVEAMCEGSNLKPSEREWLRNLKYRVQKSEWSEDERGMLYGLISFCKSVARGNTNIIPSGTFGKWAELIGKCI